MDKRSQIMNLGFTQTQANTALAQNNDDLDAAVSWLLDNPDGVLSAQAPENCAYWTGIDGSCRNGDRCQFIHSDALRPVNTRVDIPQPTQSPLSVSKASAKIRNELNELEIQMKTPANPTLRESMEQFMADYDTNKNTLTLLITNYIDDERILPDLLRLSDRMEDTKEKYQVMLTPQKTRRASSTAIRVGQFFDQDVLLSSSEDPANIVQQPPVVDASSSKHVKKHRASTTKKSKRKLKTPATNVEDPLISLEGNSENSSTHTHKDKSKDKKSSKPPSKPSKPSPTTKPDARNQPSLFILPEKHYDSTNKDPFQCSVCFDDIDAGKGYVAERCGHSFCPPCLTEYLEEKISSAAVLNIPCMEQGCNQILDYYDVKALVSEDAFRKYEQFCFFAALKEDPMVRWCANPKGCGNALICDTTRTKQVICTECKYEFCFDCNEPWHTGTCEDYQKWKVENGKEDKAFKKWANENSKQCPGCKARTQKNTGCNHMTCSNCKMEWCWICDRQAGSGHYDPWNAFGCPGQQFSGGDEVRHSNIGKRALLGTGIVAGGVVGAAVVLPLGVAAVATVAALAVPTGIGYGAYRLGKAIVK